MRGGNFAAKWKGIENAMPLGKYSSVKWMHFGIQNSWKYFLQKNGIFKVHIHVKMLTNDKHAQSDKFMKWNGIWDIYRYIHVGTICSLCKMSPMSGASDTKYIRDASPRTIYGNGSLVYFWCNAFVHAFLMNRATMEMEMIIIISTADLNKWCDVKQWTHNNIHVMSSLYCFIFHFLSLVFFLSSSVHPRVPIFILVFDWDDTKKMSRQHHHLPFCIGFNEAKKMWCQHSDGMQEILSGFLVVRPAQQKLLHSHETNFLRWKW